MTNEEIVNDFRRRYEGTFVQLCAEQRGVKVLGRITRVRADPERLANLEIQTRELGTVQMNIGSEEYQVKFEFPQPGIFQYKEWAIGFVRRAEKQYQRGLSAGNSRVMTSAGTIIGQAVSLDMNTVQAAFDHKTYNLRDGMKMLGDLNVKSVALHDNYSVCLPMRRDGTNHFIFHNYTLVGACDAKGKLTRVYQPVYKKPLTELFNG